MHIKQGENKIVIVGLFATGKTTLLNEIVKMNPDFKVYHTDDFLQYQPNLQMKFLYNKLMLDKPKRFIVEGCKAYSLLRTGLCENNFHPDVVINCVASEGTRQQRYLQPDRWYRGRHSLANKTGLKDFKAFDNQYRTIWNEYLRLLNGCQHRPRIIEHCTEPLNMN